MSVFNTIEGERRVREGEIETGNDTADGKYTLDSIKRDNIERQYRETV